ncbi:MAG TPA: segregation/condensation protein A [Candidatus Gallacutalibacter stercoravium]|nr:segregation/condensation protein A [Candidatus Gallacutalibacter stercoravium]
MEKISYKLPVFEGPLDLLLYLIRKNKLDITDIQITVLLDQYMEHIGTMQEQDLDVASEFLEMAARLVYIKSVSLLPKHEEAEALKQELSGQLLEYQDCKEAALALSHLYCPDGIVRQPDEIAFDATYKRSHRPQELYTAYLNAAGRERRRLPPSPEAFSSIVSRKIVSVASRILHVLRLLWKKGQASYTELIAHSRQRSEMVATFLAVLELVKGKRVRIEEDGETLKLLEGESRWKSKSSNRQ